MYMSLSEIKSNQMPKSEIKLELKLINKDIEFMKEQLRRLNESYYLSDNIIVSDNPN